jgi:glutamate-1-semialdehyde 2,1-aminomutase
MPLAHLPISRAHLGRLLEEEERRFHETHARSGELAQQAATSLLSGVPMSWMAHWASPHAVYLDTATGARVVDVDGNEYADLCLGDTGAMAGHAVPSVVAAVAERFTHGATAMLPTEDAAWVGDELTRRFGQAAWQFTLSATDANRFAIRIAREITSRPRILVFNGCYHGTVDETFIALRDDGSAGPRPGNVGPPVNPTLTTRVVEFNDIAAVEHELAEGDVACVLTEPVMTNMGIVLPEPGFLEELARACAAHETLLIIDETHTWSAGPGGCTARWRLTPDIVTIGKAIGGGIPAGAFGMSRDVAERISASRDADLEDVGGVGGTLAGNALSLAAMRATLQGPLADAAWEGTERLATRFVEGVRRVIGRFGLPWHIVQLGCRAEYRFSPHPPRDGSESLRAADPELERFLHLHALNRGVLLTPFHNMALMCPSTTEAQVDRHTAVFEEALQTLVDGG